MTTPSFWMKPEMVPVMPALSADARADVCIIGAGISGLSVAYGLCTAGKSVIVLEDGLIGCGETGRTTAHLVSALDDRYVHIERLHGREGARLAAESHSEAIDRIEEICRLEKIECDFERLDGYLFLVSNGKDRSLQEEFEAAVRAGLEVEFLDRAPIEFFKTGRCLRFPRQGQFHPMKYVVGLARAITSRGGRIFSGAHVNEISDEGWVKTRNGHKVSADAIVVATNTPINDRLSIHVKQGAYRTYVIAAEVPKGSVPRILLWDTTDPERYAPYHYVRIQSHPDRDVLIVGGEDHKTGQEDKTAPAHNYYERLEKWMRERFPMAGTIEYRWSGQVMEPADSLAFIGRNPGDEKITIVTGDSGSGLTHGTIAGMLIPDLILGRKNPWEELYDPARKRLRAIREYASENLNTLYQYRDWISPGDEKSTDAIPPGGGAVLRRGLHLVAVYRDERGQLHEKSAVCPHMRGVLSWNPVEKTWDCPAHGSRFTAMGKVLNGPAVSDLHDSEKPPPRGPETTGPEAIPAGL